jgi:hypothetical protein
MLSSFLLRLWPEHLLVEAPFCPADESRGMAPATIGNLV